MTQPGNSPINRAALERILQRAAELQTSEREIGEGMTPDDVIALGKEVGIPGQYLQQAMLEEQTRIAPPEPAGALDRMIGPATAMAQRVIQGQVEDVTAALVAYMEEHELLCIQRRQPGRISWEPLGGFQAAVRRSTAAFGSGKRPFMLAHAKTVTATLMPLEAGYVHVTLWADARGLRSQFVGGAAGVATAGAAATAILAVLTPFLLIAIAPIPLALGAGYAVMRQYQPKLERIQLGLERALDQLEQRGPHVDALPGRRAPGLLGMLADEIRRSMR